MKAKDKVATRAFSFLAAVFLSIPFLGASADPAPSPSDKSKPPPEQAWKSAEPFPGLRMGRDAKNHTCFAKRIGEWVRIGCSDLEAGRVDLLSGETRDLTILMDKEDSHGLQGNKMVAQFSMRQGDRRVIQWLEPDVWWWVWQGEEGLMGSGFEVTGPMFGMVAQVDWASGPDPLIAIY